MGACRSARTGFFYRDSAGTAVVHSFASFQFEAGIRARNAFDDAATRSSASIA
jgi:hypothetical protein